MLNISALIREARAAPSPLFVELPVPRPEPKGPILSSSRSPVPPPRWELSAKDDATLDEKGLEAQLAQRKESRALFRASEKHDDRERARKRKRDPEPSVPRFSAVTPQIDLGEKKPPEISSLFQAGPHSAPPKLLNGPPAPHRPRGRPPQIRRDIPDSAGLVVESGASAGEGFTVGALPGESGPLSDLVPPPKRSRVKRPKDSAALRPLNPESESGAPLKLSVPVPESERVHVDPLVQSRWSALMSTELRSAYHDRKQQHRFVLANCRRRARLVEETVLARAAALLTGSMEAARRGRKMATKIKTILSKHMSRAEELRRKAEAVERDKERQAKKLNYLLTRTELYAHFMANRGDSNGSNTNSNTNNNNNTSNNNNNNNSNNNNGSGNEALNEEERAQALADVNAAVANQTRRVKDFDSVAGKLRDGDPKKNPNPNAKPTPKPNPTPTSNGPEPTGIGLEDGVLETPRMFKGELKEYQRQGMTWLVNLYEQGINGILADEMGLGKTVQTIAFLTHLVEKRGIWGPFLVVAPKSTLPNWAREIETFCPGLKVLPYWGSVKQRKVLRRYLQPKYMYARDAVFHVLVTSYQLLVTDKPFFKKIAWEYMVLDEAQAIKSAQSQRWNTLLSLEQCRNRLLLTGTPIQNNMQELWALLHFIMPTLFDNHLEFAEWFSKDIEAHAVDKASLNQHQLQRLYMVLKPFMLRRVKRDVLDELPHKTEITLKCSLTRRQLQLYRGIKARLSVADLLDKARSDKNTKSLLNLVMQFRKVCNHPEILDRRDTREPLLWAHVDPPPNVGTPTPYMVVPAQPLISFEIPRVLFESLSPSAIPQQSRPSRPVDSPNSPALPHVHLELSDTWSFLKFADYGPSDVDTLRYADNLLVRWNKAIRERSRHAALRWRLDHEMAGNLPKRPNGHLLRGELLIRETRYALATSALEDCPGPLAALVLSVPERLSQQVPVMRVVRCVLPKVVAPMPSLRCSHPRFTWVQHDTLNNEWNLRALTGVSLHRPEALDLARRSLLERDYSSALVRATGAASVRHRLEVGPLVSLDRVAGHFDELNPLAGEGLIGSVLRVWDDSDVVPPRFADLIWECGKMRLFDRLLRRLKTEKHRVLVYSQMTTMLDILQDFLTSRGYRFVRLDGQSSLDERRGVVDAFQGDPAIFVFLLSTRAGGLGINLTAADTVIFYDSDWNPTIDAQAMDRAHRLGQKKPVTVYRLITRHTVEERILERAKQKAKIQSLVIGGGKVEMSDENIWQANEMVELLLEEEQDEDLAPGATPTLRRRKNLSHHGGGFVPAPRVKRPKKTEGGAQGADKMEGVEGEDLEEEEDEEAEEQVAAELGLEDAEEEAMDLEIEVDKDDAEIEVARKGNKSELSFEAFSAMVASGIQGMQESNTLETSVVKKRRGRPRKKSVTSATAKVEDEEEEEEDEDNEDELDFGKMETYE